jgi:hypothetical protein
MINDIIIIDDFISPSYQDKIAEETLYNPDFPWYFAASITKKIPLDKRMENDSYGFGHMFYKKQSGGSISTITNLLTPIMYHACDKINFTINELYWGRVFLTFPTVKEVFQKKYNLLHVDADIPHLVCLYYVNDSDGDTVITAATHPEFGQDEVNQIIPAPQIIKSITPKKGRAVMFDGKFYHASTNPTKNRRCIVNFDIT